MRIVACIVEIINSRIAESSSADIRAWSSVLSARNLSYSSSDVDTSTLLTFSSPLITLAISPSAVIDVPGLK